MIKVIYSDMLDSVIEEIESYLNCLSEAERENYYYEYMEVKHNFLDLVNSGIFHDACGKVLGIRGCFNNYTVTVTTDY